MEVHTFAWALPRPSAMGRNRTQRDAWHSSETQPTYWSCVCDATDPSTFLRRRRTQCPEQFALVPLACHCDAATLQVCHCQAVDRPPHRPPTTSAIIITCPWSPISVPINSQPLSILDPDQFSIPTLACLPFACLCLLAADHDEFSPHSACLLPLPTILLPVKISFQISSQSRSIHNPGVRLSPLPPPPGIPPTPTHHVQCLTCTPNRTGVRPHWTQSRPRPSSDLSTLPFPLLPTSTPPHSNPIFPSSRPYTPRQRPPPDLSTFPPTPAPDFPGLGFAPIAHTLPHSPAVMV